MLILSSWEITTLLPRPLHGISRGERERYSITDNTVTLLVILLTTDNKAINDALFATKKVVQEVADIIQRSSHNKM